MKAATVKKESRAKAARPLRVFKMQSLRSGISPIAMGACSFLQCKASAPDRRPPPWRKASCTGKPSARFPTVKGGLVPIAFGADSVASALHLRRGRDPSADAARLPRPRRGLDQNRNFLLCLDTPTVPPLLPARGPLTNAARISRPIGAAT